MEQGLMADKNFPIAGSSNNYYQTETTEHIPEPEPVKEVKTQKPAMFLKKPEQAKPKPEKIRKVESPEPEKEDDRASAQGPAQRGNPYGAWESIAPR